MTFLLDVNNAVFNYLYFILFVVGAGLKVQFHNFFIYQLFFGYILL